MLIMRSDNFQAVFGLVNHGFWMSHRLEKDCLDMRRLRRYQYNLPLLGV
jgi:hypothetical protein